VHVDDVASAVALAASEGLDGPFNVAPDRWIPGDLVPDLVAGGRPLPLPVSLAGTVAGWLWTLRLSDLPPGALALLRHPWVVANDRLRGAGWQPRYSNEEALVAGRPGSPWREMSPRRRQEVALGAAGLGVAAAVAGATTALARRRRGRA
jgi:nucleoside-diphosphate-sugar epimerase